MLVNAQGLHYYKTMSQLKQPLNVTTMQTWFASLLLIAAMLISFGVVSLDNHHQAVKEIVAEASDIGEEVEAFADDIPVTQVSFKFELLDPDASAPPEVQHATRHKFQKYVLSPRAPPHFI